MVVSNPGTAEKHTGERSSLDQILGENKGFFIA